MQDAADSNKAHDDEIKRAIALLAKRPFRELQRLGWHFQRNDYYCPLNDCDFLEANKDLWGSSEMRDIEMRLEHQEKVAAEVGRYVEELRDIPPVAKSPGTFYWRNLHWNCADALVQYGLMRSRKPRQVIEIGCGWSSLLLALALSRNAQETGAEPANVTQIEPYPRKDLLSSLPGHWQLHTVLLQRAPLELFAELGPGDVLFYDGSHCAKAGSDVNWFFFQVLPRLAPGVLIHVHDIFFPEEYPADWILNRGQTWNEQYILRAFLMNNERYQIEIANRYMFVNRRAVVEKHYAGVQPPWGTSLWMTKV